MARSKEHAKNGRITARDGRLDPIAAHRHDRRRSVRDPHVRADTAARDRGVRRADWRAVRPARGRLGLRTARRGLGRRRRNRRGAALPRLHQLERGARPEVEGHLRGLERRPRRVGRDLPRLRRGRDRHEARGPERHAADGRRGAGAPAGAGRSGGSATGSTRSSTASRPTGRGGSRSTSSIASRATRRTRPSIRRSSTS